MLVVLGVDLDSGGRSGGVVVLSVCFGAYGTSFWRIQLWRCM